MKTALKMMILRSLPESWMALPTFAHLCALPSGGVPKSFVNLVGLRPDGC